MARADVTTNAARLRDGVLVPDAGYSGEFVWWRDPEWRTGRNASPRAHAIVLFTSRTLLTGRELAQLDRTPHAYFTAVLRAGDTAMQRAMLMKIKRRAEGEEW